MVHRRFDAGINFRRHRRHLQQRSARRSGRRWPVDVTTWSRAYEQFVLRRPGPNHPADQADG
ncbi:MAG: hypothetical protein R2695_08710 [Acidimicrobiales bacterium]